MKCTQCGLYRTSVGEVRGCGTCARDGTAPQIPESVTDGAPIEDAIALKEGLGNRFRPGDDPEAVVNTADAAADPDASDEPNTVTLPKRTTKKKK